jgi:predicted phage tail protein
MARKSTNIGSIPPRITSAVRNTAIPRQEKPKTERAITQEMIAKRAYEIWASGQGGSDQENWLRAERELRGL